MQRAFDIIFSGIALLALLPILIPVMVVLRLTGEGEIFYCQQRVGRGGGMFGVWKFATMLKNSPNLGTGTVTLKCDPRVLPLGHFLRKSKINELPQLINILNGSMSIIGPRPQTRRCFDAFPIDSQQAIKTVRPGLSGIGSIVFRDEEDLMHADIDPDQLYDTVIMPFKGRLEEWYAHHQTIGTYFKLIILTVWVVVFPRLNVVWRTIPDLPFPTHASRHCSACGPVNSQSAYRQVGELHAAAIDQGFLSQLGPRFLALLYEAIDHSPGSILIVETRQERLCGFVSGGTGLGPIYRHLLRRLPSLVAALWPVVFSPRKLRRIAEVLLHTRKQADADLPSAELYSIAVSPEFRGSEVAEQLYCRLRIAFAERGICEFRILVGDELAPAQAFYRKMGAVLEARVQVHAGNVTSVFVDRQRRQA